MGTILRRIGDSFKTALAVPPAVASGLNQVVLGLHSKQKNINAVGYFLNDPLLRNRWFPHLIQLMV